MAADNARGMKKSLTKELERAVSTVAQRIELRAVRTVELSARLLGDPPDTVRPVHLDIEYSATPALLQDGFVVEGAFSLKASTKAEDGSPSRSPFLEVKYRLGVIYGHQGDLPAQDVLAAFAEMNGLIHLWPYFRAFVQESCGHLSVPGILVPPFRAITYGNADVDTKGSAPRSSEPRQD